jgi:thiamine biosynthesis protein ThiS
VILINGFKKMEWRQGLTIKDVLDHLNYNYSLITVSLNNTVIFEEDYEDTLVPDGSSIKAIHLCHGG